MIEVVAGIFKAEQGYLVAQRKASSKFPLVWEFPGGKLENGETEVNCLIREWNEELSVLACIGDKIDTFYLDYGEEFSITFYRISMLIGNIKLNVHESIAFVKPQFAYLYNMFPKEYELFQGILNENS